jgi:membrane protease YdiL (CAAX protease family)
MNQEDLDGHPKAERQVTAEPPRVFWGPVGTILWGGFILGLLVTTQAVTVVFYILLTRGVISPGQASALAADLRYDGFLLSLCTFVSTLVCGPVIFGAVKLKRGSKLKEYLGLTLPTRRQIFRWFLIMIAFMALTDAVSILSGKPIVSEFMVKAYSSLRSPWILWIALLVAAPLLEELFFRGFLIKGLADSMVRWYGAVVISSAAWALVHVQYDLYGITTVFVLGLLLGTARVKTGSTILTIFLHSFVNLGATVEVVIYLSRMSK